MPDPEVTEPASTDPDVPEPDVAQPANTDPAPSPPEAGEVSFARTLLQFFVIPMLVVALGVGIFLGFAWLVSDDTTPEEHLQRIRSGGHRERRQAAFELANRIQHGDPGDFVSLGPDLVEAFERATTPADPFVRQYLALALGTLSEAAATGALTEALTDADETVRVYAAWALGAIGGEAAVAALSEASRADDAGLRTMAVYGLGPSAIQPPPKRSRGRWTTRFSTCR